MLTSTFEKRSLSTNSETPILRADVSANATPMVLDLRFDGPAVPFERMRRRDKIKVFTV